ncbi:Uu.00g082450.m01.CDS01 [Anthostomella pinea]|uniref:Pre-mRNA-splicing factor n=1 Tax=Anthostomella pinea TaxID=933095 RepID=A0AAI8VLD5_9PEZI|nr:Uu.00g082450.m01.CDS01 [Anthostomella pinea]
MSEPKPMPQAPRIAIKFGASSSSSSKATNGSRKAGQTQPPSTLGKRPRPNALNHGSESGDDDDSAGRYEAVTLLGDDTSTREGKRRDVKSSNTGNARAPYVISGHTNRDWKADLKARRGGNKSAPHEAQAKWDSTNKDMEPADQDKQIKWGLTVTKTSTEEENGAASDAISDEQISTRIVSKSETPADDSHQTAPDDDKDAMDALLGKQKLTKDLIIKSTSKGNTSANFSEQDAYQQRVQEAAEVSTVDEYDEIPEGEFGAAMLRGMGWNGEERGSKLKEVKRRPNLMGLGSKEDEEIKKAELAKKHGHRERRPRLDEYRRDREKFRQDRDGRHKESCKSERERERRGPAYGDRYTDNHRDRDSHKHRSRDYKS